MNAPHVSHLDSHNLAKSWKKHRIPKDVKKNITLIMLADKAAFKFNLYPLHYNMVSGQISNRTQTCSNEQVATGKM